MKPAVSNKTSVSERSILIHIIVKTFMIDPFTDAAAATRFADLRIVDIVVGPDVGRHPRQEQLQLGQPAAVLCRGAREEAQRDHEPGIEFS